MSHIVSQILQVYNKRMETYQTLQENLNFLCLTKAFTYVDTCDTYVKIICLYGILYCVLRESQDLGPSLKIKLDGFLHSGRICITFLGQSQVCLLGLNMSSPQLCGWARDSSQ